MYQLYIKNIGGFGAVQKSRLGIGLGLLCSGLYFVGLLNMLALIILAGYVLLFETNEWLKKNAVTALKIVIGFSLIPYAFDLINDIIMLGKLLFTSGETSFGDGLSMVLRDSGLTDRSLSGSGFQMIIRMASEITKNAMLFFFGFKALSQDSASNNSSGNSIDKTQGGNM